MASNVVQLIDSSDASHGRRYTESDREAAYQLWRTTGGRSLRRVAEITGVAVSTLGTWSQRDGWIIRAQREDREDAESVRTGIGALITQQVARSIEVVIRIRDDEKASSKDRLNAAFWLAGVAGLAPVAKTETALIAKVAAPPEELPDLRGLNTDELMALEMKFRERRAG